MAKRSTVQPESNISDVSYVDDFVVLSRNEAWTWVVIPTVTYSFPDQVDINGVVAQTEKILFGLNNVDTDIHYHLGYRPYDSNAWMKGLKASSDKFTSGASDHFERMKERVDSLEFQERFVYLGVRLGSRAGTSIETQKASETGNPEAWSLTRLSALFTSVITGPDMQPGSEEVAKWRREAQKVRAALVNSSLAAEPLSAREMAQFLQHLQRIGLKGSPEIAKREWGAGFVNTLAPEAVLDNSDPTKLSVKLTGRNADPSDPEYISESHVAVLSVGSIEDEIAAPWIFATSRFGFPVEVSVRMKIMMEKSAEARASKALNIQINTLNDANISGSEAHGRDLRRARKAKELQQELAQGVSIPQVTATIRLVVSAPTREALGERCEMLINWYRDEFPTSFGIEWIPTDQFELYRSLFPLARNPYSLHTQDMDLRSFCVGLPFSAVKAGDRKGPYIGYTLTGAPTPVFFDATTAAGKGLAPMFLIGGSLGGGKTSLTMTILDHFRLRCYKNIILDPKGDFKAHAFLKGRGDIRVFDVSKSGKPGTLDPWRVKRMHVDPSDPERNTEEKARRRWVEESNALMSDVLYELLPDLTENQSTILGMAQNVVSKQQKPSMAMLLHLLDEGRIMQYVGKQLSGSTESNFHMTSVGLYNILEKYAKTPLGVLIFGRSTDEANETQALVEDADTLIILMSGLSFADDGARMNDSNRLSNALFALVANQSYEMLNTIDHVGPRGLFIDEAHMILRQNSGRAMVLQNARMGRSRDIAMGLISQSFAEFDNDGLRGVFSSAFVFRTGSDEERARVARMFRRDGSEAVAAAIPNDGVDVRENTTAGQCLYYDINRQVSLIKIDRWAQEYDEHFNTNPDRKTITAAGRHIEVDEFGIIRDEQPLETASSSRMLDSGDWWE